MRVVIAPDSFKGTLDAPTAAAAMAEGWRRVRPDDEVVLVPLSDGGDSLLQVLAPQVIRELDVEVTGPRGRPRPARVVGLGGSATVDGGIGVRVSLLADVRTTLADAARVYGPQKGATPDQVLRLVRGVAHHPVLQDGGVALGPHPHPAGRRVHLHAQRPRRLEVGVVVHLSRSLASGRLSVASSSKSAESSPGHLTSMVTLTQDRWQVAFSKPARLSSSCQRWIGGRAIRHTECDDRRVPAVTRSTRSKWINTVGLLAAAVALAWSAADGDAVVGWLLAAACLAGAAWASPLGDRDTLTHAEATELPSDDRVVVYARPGCSWCLRLRIVLQLRGAHVQWVDVWDDPDASAFVKSVNDGDEVVPTVVVDGRPRTNPPPSWVVNAARAA